MEIDLDFLTKERANLCVQIREMEDKVQHARGAAHVLDQLIDYVVRPHPAEETLMETLTGTSQAPPEEPSEPEVEDAAEPDN